MRTEVVIAEKDNELYLITISYKRTIELFESKQYTVFYFVRGAFHGIIDGMWVKVIGIETKNGKPNLVLGT